MQPLISILIATKNRQQYCLKAVESILDYDYQNMEVIVQDNSDEKTLDSLLKNYLSDDRLVYRYTPPPFSSIDNFNAVIELATGKYVCLIGDDDGITRNLFDVVEWANQHDIDSVSPKEFVHYIWPNDTTNGKMVIPYSTNKVWQNVPITNLQDLIEDGVIMYMKFNLPKLYHGLIRKDVLDKMKQKNGYYLGGLSPDIYAAVALSSLVNKNIVLDTAITIAGACPKSTTIDNTTGKHSGRIEDAPHFRSRNNYIWDERVPRFYSVETIWAESAIKAIKEFNIPVDLEKLNTTRILASAMNTSPDYKQLFIEETFKVTNTDENKLNLFVTSKELYVKNLAKKIVNRIPRKYFFKHYRFTGIKDIVEATAISNKVLNPLGIQNILNNHEIEKRKV